MSACWGEGYPLVFLREFARNLIRSITTLEDEFRRVPAGLLERCIGAKWSNWPDNCFYATPRKQEKCGASGVNPKDPVGGRSGLVDKAPAFHSVPGRHVGSTPTRGTSETPEASVQRRPPKNSRKIGKMAQIGFWGHFLILLFCFSYCLGEAISYISPLLLFRAGGARNISCSRPTGSQWKKSLKDPFCHDDPFWQELFK